MKRLGYVAGAVGVLGVLVIGAPAVQGNPSGPPDGFNVHVVSTPLGGGTPIVATASMNPPPILRTVTETMYVVPEDKMFVIEHASVEFGSRDPFFEYAEGAEWEASFRMRTDGLLARQPLGTADVSASPNNRQISNVSKTVRWYADPGSEIRCRAERNFDAPPDANRQDAFNCKLTGRLVDAH